jgi:predicted phosphoribosyltransferase
LADKLSAYAGRSDVVVLALPRGGIPVGYEVARALGAPLDAFVVRKLGTPGHEELAMGAIGPGGVRFLNEPLRRELGVTDAEVEAVTRAERSELERRERLYRGARAPLDVRGKTAILVDDGLATGSSMRAAIEALRHFEPARIVVAVPTGAPDTCEELRARVDELVAVITPEAFYAVGLWYQDFSQTSDEEVRDLLARAAQPDAKRGA